VLAVATPLSREQGSNKGKLNRGVVVGHGERRWRGWQGWASIVALACGGRAATSKNQVLDLSL